LKKQEQLTVYDSRECPWPRAGFALSDPQNRWTHSKSRPDLKIREYRAAADRPELVVATEFSGLWQQPDEFQKFVQLIDQVRRGSRVLFLGIPTDGPAPFNHRLFGNIFNFSALTVGAVLGFTLTSNGEADAWGKNSGPYAWATGNSRSGIPVTTHPVFRGLPGPGLMDWDYGNVVPARVPVPYRSSAEQTGPNMPVIPLESGKIAFCTLQLTEHMDTDGLAERLLANLLDHLSRDIPAEFRSRTDREEEALRFHAQQVQDCRDKFLTRS
jgi:hypothetical protein